MAKLDGKVAIVTGGARGMGAAHVRRLVAEGASVVFGDLIDDEGEKLARELGPKALYQHLDIRSESDWKNTVEATLKHFGKIDVLVNNAGKFTLGTLHEMRPEDFRLVQEINVVGPFLGMQATIPAMLAAGSGSIINVASVNGITGGHAVAAYAASKHAVIGMTKCVAMDLGRSGIRVNALCPGLTDTAMVQEANRIAGMDGASLLAQRLPIPRMAKPDEVSGMVVFLASDDSSYCTGSVYVVDGGQTAGVL